MLARRYRLPIPRSGARLPVYSRSPYFTVRAKSNQCGHNRFAMVVGRSVFKLAVERNALRRVIFTALAGHLGRLPARDVMIIAQPPANRLGRARAAEEVLRLIT